MGCTNSISKHYLVPDMYMDSSGTLKAFYPDKELIHDPKAELSFISTRDASVVAGGEEMYLISKQWISEWISFAQGEQPGFNKRIDNKSLVDPNNRNRFRSSARFKADFRLVDKHVWDFYFKHYGGGPVLFLFGML
jgi:hypothetical protein